MAEPLSIAGLAAGLVSLGLQVAGGLFDYLDAVKGRAEELEFARRQTTSMETLLLSIQDLLPQLEQDWPSSATIIERQVKSCEIELNALSDLLLELSGQSTSFSGIRLIKKLTYPFNRSHIDQIEGRQAKVSSALRTALHIAGLHVSITSGKKLSQLHGMLHAMSQTQATKAPPPIDSLQTALTLVSNPSYLSASIDSINAFGAMPAAKWYEACICTCRSSRVRVRRQNIYGSISLYSETSNMVSHLPGCRFSQLIKDGYTTSFGVDYTGLRKMLGIAIRIAFSLTRGAGGFSISPTFTYYPSVDEANAPAFRIIALSKAMMCYYYVHSVRGEVPLSYQQEGAKVIRLCFESILKLYRTSKASPNDIDTQGRSLVNFALEGLPNSANYLEGICSSATAKSVASRVPIDTSDNEGNTPCGKIVHFLSVSESSVTLSRLLMTSAPDITLSLTPELKRCRWARFMVLFFTKNLQIAEAAGCGPLSLACIAGNAGAVQNLLDRHPQSLNEVNYFGQSALHLAFHHEACARLIIGVSGQSMLDYEDHFGWTPLDYAAESFYGGTAKILLEAGCRVSEQAVKFPQFPLRVCELPEALKQRRDELRLMALDNLPQDVITSLGFTRDATLDYNALEVQRELQEYGIDIPSRLHVKGQPSSIYHTRLLPWELDLVWNLGFRDVDTFHCIDPERLPHVVDFVDMSDADRWEWLIDHGADCGTISDTKGSSRNTISVTPAHFVLSRIGEIWIQRQSPLCDFAHGVVGKLLSINTHDTCSCHCCIGGCTPFKWFLDSLICTNHPKIRTKRNRVWEFVDFHRISQPAFTKKHYKEVLRYMTFHTLGVQHTCCSYYYQFPSQSYQVLRRDPEEAHRIDMEQKDLLNLLDSLVIEFEEIAFEDRGGTPIIASEPKVFWIRRWLPRITAVLNMLDDDDIGKKKRVSAETIGVIWGPEAVGQQEDPLEYGSPEYVRRELKKIMNE